MSAVYAGVELCQTTSHVREWIERYIPFPEHRGQIFSNDPPSIFSGLTFRHNTDNNIPFRLNVLRWPQGASRWATYHFIATDQQLVTLKAQCYVGGGGSSSSGPGSSPMSVQKDLVLHGCGSEITCEMWMLPPRPVSATNPFWSRANRMWVVTLVDARYWINQDHCGELAMEDVSTWTKMLDFLRVRAGYKKTEWDCPDVHADWLQPHVELQNANSIPLGIMIDAVAWNVGRKVSFDMARFSTGYHPRVHIREWDWHDTRVKENLANPAFNRMAGGEYYFRPAGENDLSAILPDKIRVTFSDGTAPRKHEEVNVSDISTYTSEAGIGTITFFDRLEWADSSADDRALLLDRIAQAYLGFQSKATVDISYTGHVCWLPEGMCDAIEWHETHDEKCDLVPDPGDGKVRKREHTHHMARTRVYRPPLNQLVQDLWHGISSSSSSPSKDFCFLVDCAAGTIKVIDCNSTTNPSSSTTSSSTSSSSTSSSTSTTKPGTLAAGDRGLVGPTPEP